MKDYQELYETHYKGLFKYLLYLTGDYSLAEELLQETFFQAFTSLDSFKGESTVKTWLYQIAKYVFYKEMKKRRLYKLPIDEFNDILPDYITPDKELEKKENNELLLASLQELSEPYKQVIILRIFSELTFREIGKVHLKTENWARVTFHRGKTQLFKIMKKRGNEIEDNM